MKKTTYSIFFALFLLGVFAFTTSDEWYKFESKTHAFKAEYPGKPIEKVKVLNTVEGDLNLNMFEYIAKQTDKEPALVYIVGHIEYPIASVNSNDKKKLKEFYRKWTDELVTKLSGKLLKETIITLEGFEGVEVRIEIKEGTELLKIRAYMINNQFYMVEVGTETKNETHQSINKFLDSFKLIK